MYTILTFLTKIWEDILQSGRQTACRVGKRFKSGHGRARMQEHFYRQRQKRRFRGLYKSEYTIKVHGRIRMLPE